MIKHGKGDQDNAGQQGDQRFRYQLPLEVGCQEVIVEDQENDR